MSENPNDEHLAILMRGVEIWNAWRQEETFIEPQFRGADLKDVDLRKADLRKADLRNANLNGAYMYRANLYKADLSEADLRDAKLSRVNLSSADLTRADLRRADLREADLRKAKLCRTNLRRADLSAADLRRAKLMGVDLSYATLVDTRLEKATLSECTVYGVSAWNLHLDGATQTNLTISAQGESTITMDNLKLAQFLYLMLNNSEIRDIIETLTSKVVLILGRFTEGRKPVLDALREQLRKCNYVPVLFDFDGPANKDIVETVTFLARMARFIVADLTDAAMVRSELMLIVPHLPSVPVQPLLQGAAAELPEIQHLKRFNWMLPIHSYDDLPALLAGLRQYVIAPAEAKVAELHRAR